MCTGLPLVRDPPPRLQHDSEFAASEAARLRSIRMMGEFVCSSGCEIWHTGPEPLPARVRESRGRVCGVQVRGLCARQAPSLQPCVPP